MSGCRDLASRATETPDAPALETATGTWTFAQLCERVERAAAQVREIVEDDPAPVALLMNGDAGFVAWFHGVGGAGRAALPLNARLTTGELARQLEDAGVRHLLGHADDARLAELAMRVPGLRACAVPGIETLPAPRGTLPPGVAAGDTLAILFTSGTSGRAKGACLSVANFAASADAAHERLGDVVAGRWLACMPLFHVGGISILMRSIRFGGPVRLLSRFDPAEVSEVLDDGSVAAVSLVPTMLSRLLAHRGGRGAPGGLRVLLLGGAAAAPELLARALAAGYPLCPTYGLTEACSQVATAPPPAAGTASVSPMRPMPGVELRILRDGLELNRGDAGEIVVRGPTVMQGYLNDPVATGAALRDGWLHTGDIGCIDADGGLQVLDRRDDLIVSGGENVYPAEIEAILLEHPSVADAGVAGIADPDLGARVVAWIVAADGCGLEIESLQRHCRSRLAGFKQPREFRCVDSLPRNPAGKLLRRRLVADEAEG